jgi:hypothetical protein
MARNQKVCDLIDHPQSITGLGLAIMLKKSSCFYDRDSGVSHYVIAMVAAIFICPTYESSPRFCDGGLRSLSSSSSGSAESLSDVSHTCDSNSAGLDRAPRRIVESAFELLNSVGRKSWKRQLAGFAPRFNFFRSRLAKLTVEPVVATHVEGL